MTRFETTALPAQRDAVAPDATFIAKDENRGRLIRVGQDNTVNAELTIIR